MVLNAGHTHRTLGADLDPAVPEHTRDGGIHRLAIETIGIEIKASPFRKALFRPIGIVLQAVEKVLIAT